MFPSNILPTWAHWKIKKKKKNWLKSHPKSINRKYIQRCACDEHFYFIFFLKLLCLNSTANGSKMINLRENVWIDCVVIRIKQTNATTNTYHLISFTDLFIFFLFCFMHDSANWACEKGYYFWLSQIPFISKRVDIKRLSESPNDICHVKTTLLWLTRKHFLCKIKIENEIRNKSHSTRTYCPFKFCFSKKLEIFEMCCWHAYAPIDLVVFFLESF